MITIKISIDKNEPYLPKCGLHGPGCTATEGLFGPSEGSEGFWQKFLNAREVHGVPQIKLNEKSLTAHLIELSLSLRIRI